MIGIVDYGAGNLASVANALDRLSLPYRICDRPETLLEVERIVLPGVGHFGAAARSLAETGMADALCGAAGDGTPLLGICLGMQLLLESSDEAPEHPGLGLLPGRNVLLTTRRVPHMGWNLVRWPDRTGHYYFAHSYAADPSPDHLLATAELEDCAVPAAIGSGHVLGVQFHPEKSGELGLGLIEDFGRC